MMRKILPALALFAFPALAAAQTSTSTTFQVIVTINPVVSALTLSNSSYTGGPSNANALIGVVGAVTNPPGGTVPPGTLSLDSTCAQKFALSATAIPANLDIGTSNIAAGTYPCTITFTPSASTGARFRAAPAAPSPFACPVPLTHGLCVRER